MENTERSVLDRLIFIAENFKILIVGPVLVGVVVWAMSFALPRSYTSQAILHFEMPAHMQQAQAQVQAQAQAQAQAVMMSPLVLDQIIESRQLFSNEGLRGEAARIKLRRQIKVMGGKDGLLRLEVVATSPTAAQALANDVIETWVKTTVPRERERADLQMQLSYAKGALEATRRWQDQALGTRGDKAQALYAAQMAPVVEELRSRYIKEVIQISNVLQGFPDDGILMRPTLPIQPVPVERELFALLAAIITGVLSLLWVLVRRSLLGVTRDEKKALKWTQLLATLKQKS